MTITPESARELIESDDYGDRIKGLNQLRQLDVAPAFELVQIAIKDSNTRVRYAAVSQFDTLGKQDLKLSLELLRDRLINDPEVDVKAAAADAIAALKLTDAFADLEQAFEKTSEWLLQFSILAALGEMGDPRAFELLAQALKSDNNLLQTAAIGSLGELGNEEAIPLLIPFAENPDWQIRHRLAQALVNIGGENAESKSTLEKLANDEVELVAQEAKRI